MTVTITLADVARALWILTAIGVLIVLVSRRNGREMGEEPAFWLVNLFLLACSTVAAIGTTAALVMR